MVDLVPNHTSDEHEWFRQSRTADDNEYSDWYIWRDTKSVSGRGTPEPPNNWRDALTGGPAWAWDDTRQQFYLHSFDVRQPDLNWSKPEVRNAIKNAMRFWLDLGVDGFRIDAVYWMAKEPLLSDDKPNPKYDPTVDPPYEALLHNNSRAWPMVYAYLAEMADVLKEQKYGHKQRFMVTEAYPDRESPLASYMAFYSGMDPRVAAPFNFEGLSLDWNANDWRQFLTSFHFAIKQFNEHCVASYAFGNHDQSRIASRLGVPAARSAAVLLLTLPGMSFIYYGDELGMEDVYIPPEAVQDPAAKGDPAKGQGRDPARTPMQWTADKNAGFSDGEATWLPLMDKYARVNVDAELHDPQSFLSLYRKLGNLRRSSETLKFGDIQVIDVAQPEVVGFVRSHPERMSLMTLVNFSGQTLSCRLGKKLGELIVSSDPQTTVVEAVGDVTVNLRPYEGALFSVVPDGGQ
jgi:alpha-glucosidase